MRRSARVLILFGTIGAVLGVAKAHAAGHGYDITESGRLGWTVAYIGVLLVASYSAGLPSLPRSRNHLLVSSGAAVLGATLMSLVTLLTGGQLLPRFVILGAATILIPWYLLCAAVADGGRSRAAARDRVIVVGDANEGELVRMELAGQPERPAIVVGALDTEAVAGSGIGLALVQACEGADASVVVLSRRASELEYVVDQAATLHRRGVRIRTLRGFYAEWLGKVPIGELERASMLFDIGEIHGRRYARLKRILDIFGALAGCVALALAIPMVAVGNLFGNRGPLWYRQRRVGRDGAEFTIWKFRTMGAHAGPGWTDIDDDRVTAFGRFLRRSHIDELPQVVNVLRGDLSIVGPRPEQPHYVEELRGKIPFYDLRHIVRPGLTGWAQVKFGYAGDAGDTLEKLQCDFFYLERQSLNLDVRVVARTLRDVCRGGGR